MDDRCLTVPKRAEPRRQIIARSRLGKPDGCRMLWPTRFFPASRSRRGSHA